MTIVHTTAAAIIAAATPTHLRVSGVIVRVWRVLLKVLMGLAGLLLRFLRPASGGAMKAVHRGQRDAAHTALVDGPFPTICPLRKFLGRLAPRVPSQGFPPTVSPLKPCTSAREVL